MLRLFPLIAAAPNFWALDYGRFVLRLVGMYFLHSATFRRLSGLLSFEEVTS